MSRAMTQPIGQKRLTNVAVVRYKKMGKRFEVACYKNTVVNWRNGVEKDLNEVVQTTTIFANVSKGVLAKHEDMQAVFGTTDEDAICRRILADGDLQVSDKERKVQYDALFKDVASVLVQKCVNPETNRPYTGTMLERALRDAHFAVDPKRSAKQQALEALPVLQAVIPLRRANMRLRIQVAPAAEQDLELLLRQQHAIIESQEALPSQVTVICLAEPGCFRGLHGFVQGAAGGGGRLEVLSLAASEESDARPAEPDAAALAQRLQLNEAALVQPPDQQQHQQQSAPAAQHSSSGFAPVVTAVPGEPRGTSAAPAATQGELLYSGRIAGMPEEHASRRERFAEIDTLQPGWTVELRPRGSTVDASFVSPSGEPVASYALARRAALAASKACQ